MQAAKSRDRLTAAWPRDRRVVSRPRDRLVAAKYYFLVDKPLCTIVIV
jgi:hypothetical protein